MIGHPTDNGVLSLIKDSSPPLRRPPVLPSMSSISDDQPLTSLPSVLPVVVRDGNTAPREAGSDINWQHSSKSSKNSVTPTMTCSPMPWAVSQATTSPTTVSRRFARGLPNSSPFITFKNGGGPSDYPIFSRLWNHYSAQRYVFPDTDEVEDVRLRNGVTTPRGDCRFMACFKANTMYIPRLPSSRCED